MGVKDYALSSWNALAAPGKTPNQIILALNQAVVDSLNDPEVKSKLQDLFIEAQSSSPKEMRTLLENDVKRWASIIEKANVPKQ
jgi:tripartite-type tricarboxylate transporter receptor subunit TctC